MMMDHDKHGGGDDDDGGDGDGGGGGLGDRWQRMTVDDSGW